jgi:hypothetical protein
VGTPGGFTFLGLDALAGIPQMNPELEADRSDFRSDPKGLPWFLAVALHFGAHM